MPSPAGQFRVEKTTEMEYNIILEWNGNREEATCGNCSQSSWHWC